MQFIDQMDEGARMSTELDQLLNQAVDEERYDDAARLREKVLAHASASTELVTGRFAGNCNDSAS